MNDGMVQLWLKGYQYKHIYVGDGKAGIELPGTYFVVVASVPDMEDADGGEHAEQDEKNQMGKIHTAVVPQCLERCQLLEVSHKG